MRLRRIALDAQGLLRNATFGRGRSGALKAIEHLGYVQIDTISVVERAHHHTLWARVPNYRQVHLEQLVRGGDDPPPRKRKAVAGAHARWSLSLIEECEVDHPRELAALPRMGEGRDDSRVC